MYMGDDEFFGDDDMSLVDYETAATSVENASAEDAVKETTAADLVDAKIDKIIVDGWRTKMHGANIGIRQKEQWQAKSRKWTDFTVAKGQIEFYDQEYEKDEDGKLNKKGENKLPRKEIIGLDTFYWRTDSKSALTKKYGSKKKAQLHKKLIIRTFIELKEGDANAGRWTGSLEMSLLDSLTQTFGEHMKGMPSFSIAIPGHRTLIKLTRTHTKVGEEFTFPLLDEKTGELRIIQLREKRLTPGKDFTVIDMQTDIDLGTLDDKKGDLGGKVEIELDVSTELGRQLAKNHVFRRVLILFSAAVYYLDDCYKALVKLKKAMKEEKKIVSIENPGERKAKAQELVEKGKLVDKLVISKHEQSLHYNPRRLHS